MTFIVIYLQNGGFFSYTVKDIPVKPVHYWHLNGMPYFFTTH